VDPPGRESQPLEDTWDSLSLLDEEEEVKHAHLASVQALAQGRSYAPGRSAAGVSVLSTQGRIGDLSNALIDLRLDSCADVTLLSKRYYLSMKNPPPLKQGLRLKLYQLTNKKSRIAGYVDLPVFMTTTEGETIWTTAEAYVVPDMTVNILLGEDYQLNYAVNVVCLKEGPSLIKFANQNAVVSAVPVGACLDSTRVQKSRMSTQSFVKAASHRRLKSAHQHSRPQHSKRVVQLLVDVIVSTQSVVRLSVSGNFGTDPEKEWFVDRGFVQCNKSNMLAMDPSFFKTKAPMVSVFNAAQAT
jgi:hypothetical protein